MLIKRPDDIRPSEITPRSVYEDRRQLLFGAAGALALAGTGALPGEAHAQAREKIAGLRPAPAAYTLKDPLNTYEQITSYTNFYEFGTDKSDPLRNSKNFRTRPWTVAVEGEVHKPRTFGIDDLLKLPFSSITEENVRKHQSELDRLNAEIAETTRTYPHEFWLKDLSLLKV